MTDGDEYETPQIVERASVGDPLIVGYISPRWRSTVESDEDRG